MMKQICKNSRVMFVRLKSMVYSGVLVSLCRRKNKIKMNSHHLARLVPLAYTIKKLQITCVVEDDKVRIFVSKFQQRKTSYLGWN